MQIANEHLRLTVAYQGAEPLSLRMGGREYLWQGDPAYWKRHAPILFPIVGRVRDNTYRLGGHVYHLPQHGFARDSLFHLLEQTPHSLALRLKSNADTLAAYPCPFELTARYSLDGTKVLCEWEVHNPATEAMHFQIGAHPAFNHPLFCPTDAIFGHLLFYRQGLMLDHLRVTRLNSEGYATADTLCLPTPNGSLALHRDLFQHDALILEGGQTDRVVLLDRECRPVAEVAFDAPVVGLWSPVGAPFCCIEPWYGRTEAADYHGPFEQRQHTQHLAPGDSFRFRYLIRLYPLD